MNYTIEKVTTLIGARRYGDNDASIGWLLTDSRSLCFPEQTLFFAMKTKRNDGHRYIDELYRRGVRSFVVEQVPERYDEHYPKANFLRVPSPLAALQRLAERHRDEFDIPVVGITGSNGKTWVKEWLYQLLRMPPKLGGDRGLNGRRTDAGSDPQPPNLGGYVTRSPRSYNSQIGVPLSVWLLNEQSRIGIFEAGISEPGEMLALRDIIQPTIGVFTSLGTAHQENFRSLEEKCMEKLQLFHDTKAIVYPSDNDTVSRCMRRSQYQGERIGWSRYNDKVPMYIKSVEGAGTAEGQERSVTVCYVFKGTEGCYTIPYSSEAAIENSITCAATALYLGLTPDELACRMEQLEPIAMRLEVKEGQRGLTLINDAYNNDVNSLDIALDFVARRNHQSGKLKVTSEKYSNSQGSLANIKSNYTCHLSPDTCHCSLILSDIYQSGEAPATLYAQVASLLKERGVDKLIGIGQEISAQAALFQVGEKYFFPTTEAFLQSQAFRDLHDEVVLLKGSRSFGFEHISDLLEQKVHETILEVDLNAVVDNLNHFRSFLKPETKMVCMIKADAYGAGAIEIARTLQQQRVDYLAVATADEGAELRRAGITQNIIVMNPEMSSFKTLFDYDLEPEVYSFRLMDALIRAARAQGIAGWPVHIKLDTGMHRLGFNVVGGEATGTAEASGAAGTSEASGAAGTSESSESQGVSLSQWPQWPQWPQQSQWSQQPQQSQQPSGDLPELISRLRSQQAIIPRSVFTHFVGSDSDDYDAFSARQYQLFCDAAGKLQAAFPHKILRHIDNSAGIEHFPDRQLDMCRLGIGLYGVEPYVPSVECRVESGEFATAIPSTNGMTEANSPLNGTAVANSTLYTLHSTLSPVSTLKTTILQLRRVPKEETVGYSRKGILERDSVIAAIPIGYADGLNRRLGCRRGYCLVNGQKAEYVGNICMDVALIDVTDIPCQEGDSVEIFGKNLPVTVLSDILDTIPYEVLTSVSNRVKRTYYLQ